MVLPPAVVIHGLEDARLALGPRRPVTLLSGPAAACYGGCLWWFCLLQAAQTTQPALLDCADAPGRAIEALRMGLKGLVLYCAPGLYAEVAGVAELHGALLLPARPPALDLSQRGAPRRLAAWLAG